MPYIAISKLRCLLLLCCLASVPSWGQSFVRLSQPLQRKESMRTYSLLYSDSAQYYALRTTPLFDFAEMEVYDKKMRLVRTTEVAPLSSKRFLSPLNLLGDLYLLRLNYQHDKEKDIYKGVSLYAHPIDSTRLTLRGDSINLIEPFTMKSNLYRGDFAVSPDRSKFLVFDYEEDGDIEGVAGLTNSITLRVYDLNFNLQWKRTINLAPENTVKRIVSIKKLRVSNEGTVGILVDIFRNEEERSYSLKKPTANPTLFFVGREPNDFMRFTPNLGDFFFNETDFNFDIQNNIIWFGCYSLRQYYQQVGIFSIKINADRTKVLYKKKHDFAPTLIAQILQKRKIKPLQELRNYRLASWRISPNGEVTMALEYQPPSTYNFRSHQVLVLRLSADGDLRWAVPIFKFGDLANTNEAFLSHYLMTWQDDVYIFYNTGINTENQAIVVKITADGQRSQRVLFNYIEQGELLCPRLSYPVGEGNVFVCLQSRFFKYYGFGIINLPALFATQ